MNAILFTLYFLEYIADDCFQCHSAALLFEVEPEENDSNSGYRAVVTKFRVIAGCFLPRTQL